MTVEQICEAANISRRTFFNYVDTKESAVLGRLPTAPSAHTRDAFLAQPHGDSLLRDIVDLMVEVSLPNLLRKDTHGPADKETATRLIRRRKTIQNQYPELRYARMIHGHTATEEVTGIIAEGLRRYPSDRSLDSPVQMEARTLVAVAHAAVMLGVNCWLESSSSDASALCAYAHHALHTMYSLKGMVE